VVITRELDKKSLLDCYLIYTITCGLYYNYASTVYAYPKVHASSMSTLCIYYVVTIQLTYSLTSSFRLFPTSLDSFRLLYAL